MVSRRIFRKETYFTSGSELAVLAPLPHHTVHHFSCIISLGSDVPPGRHPRETFPSSCVPFTTSSLTSTIATKNGTCRGNVGLRLAFESLSDAIVGGGCKVTLREDGGDGFPYIL